MPPRQRTLRHATVTSSRRLSPNLIRLSFSSPELVGADLPFTDHYIKLVFPAADGEDQPSVTRTYTLRSFDLTAGTLDVDFVEHGTKGLAGPWAARATVGEEISFYGPGGAWAPTEGYDSFVLAGDEAAAPAIAAALEALPEGAKATAFIEIADDTARFDMPSPAGAEIVWVPRDGAPYGSRLAEAVRAAALPADKTAWFVHGVAEMVKDLRRYLFVEQGLDRADVSISGYWRTGMTEDGWQSSKREFVASLEEQEAAAIASTVAS